METKVCSKCNIEQNISNFNIKNKKKNIFMPWCKECIKGYDKKDIKVFLKSRNKKNNKDNVRKKTKCIIYMGIFKHSSLRRLW